MSLEYLVHHIRDRILAGQRGVTVAPRLTNCTSLERHDGPPGEFLNRELHRQVQLSVEEQLRRRDAMRFRGGLVFKARRLLYHSSLGRE